MNKSFEYWKNRQNQLGSELIEIKKIIKEICPHDNIKYIHGSKDFHSIQWWVYPAYQCEDCEMYGSSNPSASKISQEIFKKFDRKYQEDVLFNQILNEWIELINQKLDIEMKNKNNLFTNMIVLRFDNLSKEYLKDALHNSIFKDKVKEIYVSNGWKNVFFDTIWDNTTQQMIYKITLKTKDHAPIV